jgi:hypothetical protein
MNDSPISQPFVVGRLTNYLVAALFLLLVRPAHALQLRGYDAERHDRFTGFPGAPVISTTFIHQDVDLTGVGWRVGGDQPRSLTLISPKYFLAARHYRPGIGNTIRFVASDGTVRNYTVAARHDILNDDSEPTDLSLCELTQAVGAADGVRFQTYLNLPTEGAYLSPPYNQLIVLGKRARGGNGIASAINDFFGTPFTSGAGINDTRSLQFVYQSAGGGIDDAYVEVGDSGSPSLVNIGGRGAVVGIHTAVVSASATVTSIDSFVPHPPYISQINAIMASDGYHMSQALPSSLALALEPVVPTVIRAGYPASLSLEINNPDPLNAANNLKVALDYPGAIQTYDASGPLWVADVNGSSVAARKGGLAAAATTTLSTSFTAAAPLEFTLTVEYSADESGPVSQAIELQVIESYLSWSGALSDPAGSADIDSDQIPNLLEYAFGGDPESPSLLQPDGVTPLLPRAQVFPARSELEIQFVRRTDAATRALSYQLQQSASLENASWLDASSNVSDTAVQAVNDDFEQVTLTLPSGSSSMFYRLLVTLSESP